MILKVILNRHNHIGQVLDENPGRADTGQPYHLTGLREGGRGEISHLTTKNPQQILKKTTPNGTEVFDHE